MKGDETTRSRRTGGGSVRRTSVGEAWAPNDARAVAEVELGYAAFASDDDDIVEAIAALLALPLRGVVVDSSGWEAVADDDEVVGPGGPLVGPGILSRV